MDMGAIRIEEIDAHRLGASDPEQAFCDALCHLGESGAGGDRLGKSKKAFEGQMKPEVIDGVIRR